MWTDWIHWLSSISPDELLLIVAPLVCLDGVRYCFASIAMCVWDALRELFYPSPLVKARVFDPGSRITPSPTPSLKEKGTSGDHKPYYPSVCVILAGLNESETIVSTLESVWGSYPNLEIIVVDDGSSDGMAELAHGFAESHDEVLVLRKPNRGGKSSALNLSLIHI